MDDKNIKPQQIENVLESELWISKVDEYHRLYNSTFTKQFEREERISKVYFELQDIYTKGKGKFDLHKFLNDFQKSYLKINSPSQLKSYYDEILNRVILWLKEVGFDNIPILYLDEADVTASILPVRSALFTLKNTMFFLYTQSLMNSETGYIQPLSYYDWLQRMGFYQNYQYGMILVQLSSLSLSSDDCFYIVDCVQSSYGTSFKKWVIQASEYLSDIGLIYGLMYINTPFDHNELNDLVATNQNLYIYRYNSWKEQFEIRIKNAYANLIESVTGNQEKAFVVYADGLIDEFTGKINEDNIKFTISGNKLLEKVCHSHYNKKDDGSIIYPTPSSEDIGLLYDIMGKHNLAPNFKFQVVTDYYVYTVYVTDKTKFLNSNYFEHMAAYDTEYRNNLPDVKWMNDETNSQIKHQRCINAFNNAFSDLGITLGCILSIDY